MGNNQIISSKEDYQSILGQIKLNKYLKYEEFIDLRPQQMQKVISELGMTAIKPDDKSNKENNYFLSVIQCLDQYSCSKLSCKINSRLNIQFPHVLKVQKITSLDQTHLCSTSQKVYLLLEGFDFNLKQLSDGKLRKKEAFSEEQILLILGKIVEGKVWMNDNGWRAVGMDMETIGFVQQGTRQKIEYVDKQILEGCRCKFIDQDISQLSPFRQLIDQFTSFKTNGHNLANNESVQQGDKIKLPFYLSPQQLEQFNSNRWLQTSYCTSGSGSSKFQVFSLGMLMMQLCCQQEMFSYYSVNKKLETIKIDFDYESLIHRIAKICYSNELKLLLAQMLQYEQGNRVGFVSLKEKVQKLMIKPFEETRRLKRRSSSTSMLKELLSCSRATESQKDAQKLEKNQFDCVLGLSGVKQKVKCKAEQVTGSVVVNKNGNLNLEDEIKQMRKSSSLVNLKCRTNQFLSSTKKQVITNSKTNDANQTNVQLKLNPMINSKRQNEHYTKLTTKAQKLLTNPRITYQEILKNRLKTQPQKQIVTDERMESQTDRTVVRQIYQENETERENQKGNSSKCMNSQLSYVKKKVINLERLNVQTSYNKVAKENNANNSAYQQNHANKMLTQSSAILQNVKIEVSSQQPTQRKTQPYCNSRMISDTITTKSSTSLPKLLANKNRSTSSSMKKLVLNINLSKNSLKKTNPNKELVNDCSVNQDIKNEGVMGKGWIMGKLRAKNGAQKSFVNDQKNMNNQSQCLSTGGKPDQFNPLTLKYESPLQTMPFTNTLTTNDTIIKRLLLNEEKPQQGQKQQNSVCISSVKPQKSHNQTENCNNSNFDQGNIKATNNQFYEVPQNNPNQIKKVSQSKSVNQFKKKSKIIDIDLSSNFSKSLTSSQQQINANNLLSKNPTKTNKLQKLKQLTIYTQNLEQNSSMNLYGPKAQNYVSDAHNNDKQNSMQHMNRGQIQSLGNKDNKEKIRQEKMQNKTITEQTYHNPRSGINFQLFPKTIQCYNIATINLNANLQPKSSNNLISNEGNPLKTPSNLSEWSRLYGNGLTLKSEQVSDHKKEYSTLTKPFQQIQLNYLGYGQTDRSNTDKFDLEMRKEQDICEEKFDRFYNLSEYEEQRAFIKEQPCTNKAKLMYTINEDELTFRLKPQLLIGHQVKSFEQEDGSFVMRQENKNLQSSSIIGHNSKYDEKRNTIQQLFDEKSKHILKDSEQHKMRGSQRIVIDWQGMLNEKDQYDEMNSECDSMDLSDIEYTRSQHVPLMANNQRIPKYKHISILQPGEAYYYTHYQQEQSFHNSSSEMVNGREPCFQVATNHMNQDEACLQQESSTFRSYLQSARGENAKRIELQNGFVYQGLVNEEGEFQGKGMILRRIEGSKQEKIVYAGQFLNGLYHGFGTLYEISDKETRRLKLPKQCERLSFGVSSAQEKHFSLTSCPIDYVGEFRQGQQHGFGTYSFQNGDKFKGNIVKGVVEGFGCYEFADKYIPTIQGCWKQNAFVKNDKK